jgi:hypothetical protein
VWFAVWRKMKTDSEPNFARSYWNGYEVLSWIAYRNPDKLGIFNELRLLKFSKARWRREELYPLKRKNADLSHPDYWDAELIESPWAGTVEADYEGILLNALRDGEISTYRNEKLPKESWWGRSPTAEEWGSYFFKKSDVLKIWKKDGSVVKKRRSGRLDEPYWVPAEQALRAKCEKEGLPKPDRLDDWRTQGAAERFLADFLAKSDIHPGDESLRRHAKKVLTEFEEKHEGS